MQKFIMESLGINIYHGLPHQKRFGTLKCFRTKLLWRPWNGLFCQAIIWRKKSSETCARQSLKFLTFLCSLPKRFLSSEIKIFMNIIHVFSFSMLCRLLKHFEMLFFFSRRSSSSESKRFSRGSQNFLEDVHSWKTSWSVSLRSWSCSLVFQEAKPSLRACEDN